MSSSDFFFSSTLTFWLLGIQAVVTGAVLPFSPHFVLLFSAHRVQHPLMVDISSIVANSRSRAFGKSIISAQDENDTSTHSRVFKLTEFTYTRLDDIT